jgi:predicted nucleic acid-binding Zn ribbon protein
MPNYRYRREDGEVIEVKQSITDEPLDECPETGQSVQRIIQPDNVTLGFKGSGFHTTDYTEDGPEDKEVINNEDTITYE